MSTVGRLELAISGLRVGIASFDASRSLVLYNKSFTALLGLSDDALREGLPFEDLITGLGLTGEYDWHEGRAFLGMQLALDRNDHADSRYTRRSGQVVQLLSDPQPGGGWTITAIDISPLARAQDEAGQRASLLGGILSRIPHGICVYGPDRRLAFRNAAYSEIMQDAPIVIGESVELIVRRRALAGEFGPGDPDTIVAQQLAHDLGRPQTRRRKRPNGATIDIRTAPLPDGGHISVVTDVTSLIQAEGEASRRAEEMGAMLASIRHGIVLFNDQGRVLAANPVASELIGQPLDPHCDEWTNAVILDRLCSGGRLIGRPDQDDPGLTPSQAELQRYRLATRTGRTLEIRFDPAPGGASVLTLTDVTETQRVEAELRRAKEAAEAANQAKSRFLATMSHELRTPLNAVIGFSDALMREAAAPDPGHVEEFAQAVNEAGNHLLSLINSILDVARIEAGRFDLSADRIDLPRLLQACARQVDSAARAAEITVSIETPPGLPFLQGDERRLRQAISNLLSNAVKFTEAGGEVTVLAAMGADGDLALRVADTGIGIPPEDLERVFEPFVQLDGSLARRFQGAGLGLYVSRALVRAQGGTLRLSSQPGAGTMAEIRIPARNLIWPATAGMAGSSQGPT